METMQKSSKLTTLNWVITHSSSTDQTTQFPYKIDVGSKGTATAKYGKGTTTTKYDN